MADVLPTPRRKRAGQPRIQEAGRKEAEFDSRRCYDGIATLISVTPPHAPVVPPQRHDASQTRQTTPPIRSAFIDCPKHIRRSHDVALTARLHHDADGFNNII